MGSSLCKTRHSFNICCCKRGGKKKKSCAEERVLTSSSLPSMLPLSLSFIIYCPTAAIKMQREEKVRPAFLLLHRRDQGVPAAPAMVVLLSSCGGGKIKRLPRLLCCSFMMLLQLCPQTHCGKHLHITSRDLFAISIFKQHAKGFLLSGDQYLISQPRIKIQKNSIPISCFKS